MDQHHFTVWARSVSSVPSRRDVLRGLTSAGLGLGALRLSDAVAAKNTKKKGKKRKHKKRNQVPNPPVATSPPALPPLVFNRYGCVEVGRPCRGDNTNCCSGICQGAAPAAGQPDASRCVAHNAGFCTTETNSCELGVDVRCNPSVPVSLCTRTTGNAAFCADISAGTTTHCRVCTRDTDCQGEFGPGAACVVLDGACTTLCLATGRTACLPAGA
jgi:hypothetical protein